ncbi:response regulator transcription factor [Pelagicoccus albus]|uniref:Response regulator transcription factor n=1 Tax=Pelagicoccus albus TaxID=415222 RepID=A0A7X1B5U7_9BACT|nr:response regulator transcription factor [Pelagicoccus albus]MBC2606162.1 response regulator transcription factor [Pelagicoccus albus]
MRVLIVEDSPILLQSVTLALQHSGYAVDGADNGIDGLHLAEQNQYDAIILDIMLPGLDGLSIMEKLRAKNNRCQAMFLTARDTVDDRVKGLQLGADDYLVKPFAIEELLARVQALCRRAHGQANSKIEVDDLTIDTNSRKAFRAGQEIDLTAREFNLLEYLAMRAGSLVSRTEIEDHIYDDLVSPMSNVVDVGIYTLRKKIKVTENSAQLIHTRRGLGYVLELRA